MNRILFYIPSSIDNKASFFSFFLFTVARGRVPRLTHRLRTLYSSTRITDAPLSHVPFTQYQCTMADAVDVRRPIPINQRGVSEFLTAEGSSPTEIHRRLRSAYCQDAIDVSPETLANGSDQPLQRDGDLRRS